MNKRQQPRRQLRPEIRVILFFVILLLLVQFFFAVVAAQIVTAMQAPREEPAEQVCQTVHITETETEAEPLFYIVEHEPEPEPEPIRFEAVPLDADLKDHIIDTAEAAGIEPALIFAMIDVESDYQADKLGDGGDSLGLLQIQPRWHSARMERLGCTDLLDPCQNVTVGVDFLSELIAYYDGDVTKAVISYNMGQAGAQRNCFNHGIYSTVYSEAVFDELAELQEV